ncbi:MAG: T9SS type A sorting domain-containing protein [Flavobacteriales bacterium]|nr:T9SS type A sorting domain-containing protein [Flavobacteriales bacterium]
MKALAATCLLMALSTVGTAQNNVVQAEYWVNSDPGFGSATPIALSSTTEPDLIDETFTIPASDLEPGFNRVGIRTMDSNGDWGLTHLRTVHVTDTSRGTISRIEYFWDVEGDPGFGMATSISNPPTGVSDWNGPATINVPEAVIPGPHIVYFRVMDDLGRWGLTYPMDTIVTSATSVASLASDVGVHIHPNPFVDQLQVRLDDTGQLRVILYDPAGKLVYDHLIREHTTIPTNQLAQGTYTAFFWKEEHVIHRVTLVKQ